MAQKQNNTNDGGYYAIKGFTFQFDKTLSEVLKNRNSIITVEQVQDLGRDNYYIQVKHKEAAEYIPSKIKKPVLQLLEDYKNHPDRTYSLYCFFKDQPPATKILSVDELDAILGNVSQNYGATLKSGFVERFILEFSVDFTKQFKTLISDIVTAFGLKSEEEGVMYHAAFRSALLKIAIERHKSDREINFTMLEELVKRNEKIVFDAAYSKYLTKKRYHTYVKKTYFTFKGINTPSHERLIEIRLSGKESIGSLIQIIKNIGNRFYLQDNSPAPFILLTGLPSQQLYVVKQRLWTSGIHFLDGTNFHGDKFRIDEIQVDVHKKKNNNKKVKLIDDDSKSSVMQHVEFDKIYVFVCDGSTFDLTGPAVQAFYMQDASDILEVIK